MERVLRHREWAGRGLTAYMFGRASSQAVNPRVGGCLDRRFRLHACASDAPEIG